MKAKDAKGFGALEHPTSTTVVMPEMMGLEMLQEQLKRRSYEFFHIVTPLMHSFKRNPIFWISTILKCQNIYGCTKELPNTLLTYSK